jgi:hypothetical protein
MPFALRLYPEDLISHPLFQTSLYKQQFCVPYFTLSTGDEAVSILITRTSLGTQTQQDNAMLVVSCQS